MGESQRAAVFSLKACPVTPGGLPSLSEGTEKQHLNTCEQVWELMLVFVCRSQGAKL